MSGPNKRRALLTGALLSGVYCILITFSLYIPSSVFRLHLHHSGWIKSDDITEAMVYPVTIKAALPVHIWVCGWSKNSFISLCDFVMRRKKSFTLYECVRRGPISAALAGVQRLMAQKRGFDSFCQTSQREIIIFGELWIFSSFSRWSLCIRFNKQFSAE